MVPFRAEKAKPQARSASVKIIGKRGL